MIASMVNSAPVQWCEHPGQLRANAEPRLGVLFLRFFNDQHSIRRYILHRLHDS
jgi:hypothetical protein